MFKLGLIINPFAGIGGRVGLKGSDGEEIKQQALSKGAIKLANMKSEIALQQILPLKDKFKVYTVSGDMGENLCQSLNLSYSKVLEVTEPSTAEDTKAAITELNQHQPDLILFAGGDGTARNIYEVCEQEQVVLGIPAGVKIHSGVYAISPQAAGLLVKELLQGKVLSLLPADVMDIDEEAFRKGIVKAKKYGYLNVPAALEYVQAVKSAGTEKESEVLVLEDIAAEVIESMDDDIYYVIGSGSTCAAIMQALDLENTLLGSDIVFQGQLYQSDAIEKDFLTLLSQGKTLKFVITVIGGQGHILGRGNQQISPQVIQAVGWDHFMLVATKTKLQQLTGRPLLVDTGDPALDRSLSGSVKIITGYRDRVIYSVGSV